MRVSFAANLFLMIALRHSAAFMAALSPVAARSSSTVHHSTGAAAPTKSSSLVETSPSYKELLGNLQQISNLKHSQAVLSYDQLVFMPQSERALAARGAQLAALASIIHEKSTSPSIKDLIEKAKIDMNSLIEGEQDVCRAKSDERILLELALEELEKNERIPQQLEVKRAMLSSSAYSAWVKARANNDFASFEPVLADCFETAKETARAVRADDMDKSLYTVMLDEFERGIATERIDAIFQEIEAALVPLLTRVLAASLDYEPSTDCLKGRFDVETQQKLNRDIIKTLGFDEQHGRIDVSVHPFTSSFSPADVRITSRFSDDEWYNGLAGSIHEAGHAMYEQNLGESNTAIDTFLSMGCHESQSLFWERHVSLSKPFWKWAAPQLEKAFGMENCEPEQVYGAVNAVKPGLIRVTADELTYPLHVILRYNIERDVVEGKLAVADIPKRWNAGMKQMLNVTVPSDSEGCLQDVHWSGLAIGYFPTYLIGSATAAQLAHYCKKDIPDFDAKVEAGAFMEIKQWLTDKVHKHGRRYSSLDALLQEQLGEKLNPKYFIDYLTEKYTELYKC